MNKVKNSTAYPKYLLVEKENLHQQNKPQNPSHPTIPTADPWFDAETPAPGPTYIDQITETEVPPTSRHHRTPTKSHRTK
jgi:hypothetical protein